MRPSAAMDSVADDVISKAHQASDDPKQRMKMMMDLMKTGDFQRMMEEEMKSTKGKKRK